MTTELNTKNFDLPTEQTDETLRALAEKELKKDLSLQTPEPEKVKSILDTIDIENTETIEHFGSEISEQTRSTVRDFSKDVLSKYKGKDLSDLDTGLGKLIVDFKKQDPQKVIKRAESKNPLLRLFGRGRDNFVAMQVQFSNLDEQIDVVTAKTIADKKSIEKDNEYINGMIDNNINIANELNNYIVAGKQKLEDLKRNVLPAMDAEAEQERKDGLGYEVAQNRYKAIIDTSDILRVKIDNLSSSKTLLLQQSIQLRMIQKTNRNLIQQANTLVDTALPAYGNTITMAIEALRSAQVAKNQKNTSDTINRVIEDSGKMIGYTAKEVAKNSSQSVISVETLEKNKDNILKITAEIDNIVSKSRQELSDSDDQYTRIQRELQEGLTSRRKVN